MLVAGIFVAIAGVALFATVLDVTAEEPLSLAQDALAGVSYKFESVSGGGRVQRQFDSNSRKAGPLTFDQLLAISRESLNEGQLQKALDYNEKVRGLDIQQQANYPWLADNYSFLAKSFRSFALFLALEAIAWFLLRQYRFAITDFKQLFRMHAKREGYYLAFRVSQAGGSGSDAAIITVAASLLQEDLSGRLAKDQTTEEIVERTLVESNPITDLWGKIIDRLTQPKPTTENEKRAGSG